MTETLRTGLLPPEQVAKLLTPYSVTVAGTKVGLLPTAFTPADGTSSTYQMAGIEGTADQSLLLGFALMDHPPSQLEGSGNHVLLLILNQLPVAIPFEGPAFRHGSLGALPVNGEGVPITELPSGGDLASFALWRGDRKFGFEGVKFGLTFPPIANILPAGAALGITQFYKESHPPRIRVAANSSLAEVLPDSDPPNTQQHQASWSAGDRTYTLSATLALHQHTSLVIASFTGKEKE